MASPSKASPNRSESKAESERWADVEDLLSDDLEVDVLSTWESAGSRIVEPPPESTSETLGRHRRPTSSELRSAESRAQMQARGRSDLYEDSAAEESRLDPSRSSAHGDYHESSSASEQALSQSMASTSTRRRRRKKKVQQRKKLNRAPLCLAESLTQLVGVDADYVVRCNKLSVLGAQRVQSVRRLLEEHFGHVTNVLPARPTKNGIESSLAFAVFEDADVAQQVIHHASALPEFEGIEFRQFTAAWAD